jgi:hypothetical protein
MAQNTVNYTNTSIDQTVRIFDSFYSYDANVPSDQYDIVFSYFNREMKDKTVAGNFTASLFQVADVTGIDALTLLDSFKGVTGLDLTLNMAYYLNQIRSRATLLGVNSQVVPNYYAARNVLQ